MTNAAEIGHWNGAWGDNWVSEAERYDAMLRPFGQRICELLNPRPGMNVLDVGCGNGELTITLAQLVGPTGRVTGVDVSAPMLAEARRRASTHALDNVTFAEVDAQIATFSASPFDAVVSRFGVMFFENPTAAFANLARALRPGGRLVYVCWRELALNEYVMVPAAAALEHLPIPDVSRLDGPGPYSMSSREGIEQLLTATGFVDLHVDEVDELVVMGRDAHDVVGFLRGHEFAETLFDGAPVDAQEAAWSEVVRVLQTHERAGGIQLGGAAWLVSAAHP